MGRWHKPVKGSRAYWPRKRAVRMYPQVGPAGPPHARRALASESPAAIESHRPIGGGSSLGRPAGSAAGSGSGAGALAFAGYKAGMTQVLFVDPKKGAATQGKEVVRPATVIEAPALVVQGIRCYRAGPNGLEICGQIFSERVAKDLRRRLTLPAKPAKPDVDNLAKRAGEFAAVRLLVHTQPREAFGKKTPELFELPLGGTPQQQWDFAASRLGGALTASEVLKPGEFLDVKAVSTGKGFQGPVKRFGIKIKGRKNMEKHRHVGTLGPITPDRVQPNTVAFAGQMGFQTRTEYNKRLLRIGKGSITPAGGFLHYGVVDSDYVLVEGSVPGPKKRLVILRKGVRAPAALPVELKHVSQESLQ